MTSTVSTPVFGFSVCACGKGVLNEVAWKTGGRCAECYRAEYSKILEPAILRAQGQRIELHPFHSTRTPSERKQRKRTRKQNSDRVERNRKLMLAQGRARLKLQKIFPEIYELLLADERADLGLEAWSIDRAITPFLAESTLEFVRTYHRL